MTLQTISLLVLDMSLDHLIIRLLDSLPLPGKRGARPFRPLAGIEQSTADQTPYDAHCQPENNQQKNKFQHCQSKYSVNNSHIGKIPAHPARPWPWSRDSNPRQRAKPCTEPMQKGIPVKIKR